MDQANIKARITAADRLLAGETTTLEKVKQVRELLLGFNPKIDGLTKRAVEAVSKIDEIQKGEVGLLAAESLPEDTPERKKRKKLILAFLVNWKALKSEVARVETQWGQRGGSFRVLRWAKGPLGVVTVAAVGIVWLKSAAVTVDIKNAGCQSLVVGTSVNINLPGLKLPNGEIKNGETRFAEVPPVTLTVDASRPGMVELTGYGLNFRFNKGQASLVWNGQPLEGKRTEIRLGEKKNHQLVVSCL